MSGFEKYEAELFQIEKLTAREILDSRGNPTVEVDLVTTGGVFARAAVPSGASTGVHEACELRDGDKGRYGGKGVLKAVASVNDILLPALRGFDVKDQKGLDDKMRALDGTPNKSKLGANAILGVSLAAAKAAADAKCIPFYQHIAELAGNYEHDGAHLVLPVPCFNVINGGSHAENKLAFQELFIIPIGAGTFPEACRMGAECYHVLKEIIKKKFGGDATLIGDEGGFAPPCDVRQGLEMIMEAIEKAGYKGKCQVGMDVAASEFKVQGQDCYDLGRWYPEEQKAADPSLKMTGAQLADFYAQLCRDFPIITIEDPFDQDDWSAWQAFTTKVGEPTQVVGDDLTVTNVTRIQKAIDTKACNALLLKVNQIGTLTESIEAVKLCKRNGWGVMCSHRSGETEDFLIADIAVGLCCGQIKAGAPCRSDRCCKYNQLIRIAEELGDQAAYAGATWRQPAWMGAEDGVPSISYKTPDVLGIFSRFDVAKSGVFEKSELMELMRGLQVGEESGDLQELICSCDRGTGFINYSEFVSLLTGNHLIERLVGREVLDSRGNPTVEVDLITKGGIHARATVPSGASTGIHEAFELRDGDKDRYHGKGVQNACRSVNATLALELKGFDVKNQRKLDMKMQELDGTGNKSKLGANAILGVSLAAAKAAAMAKGVPLYKHIADISGNPAPVVLPVPCFNVVNGGSHAGNKLAFQEYFIIPIHAASFKEALRIGSECYHTLKGVIKAEFGGAATLIGDEGGFAPPCDARKGVELVWQAIKNAGYQDKCAIGMDVAASEFKVDGKDVYDLGKWYPDGEKDDPKLKLTGAQLCDFYIELCKDFPIITIEDPFDQDDWAAWINFTEKVGSLTQVVGDDLTVTNVSRVQTAIDKKACNSLLLKVNQIGSLTESIDAVRLCKKSGWGVMCSHRSGETADTTIADIAVGLCTGQIKTGAPCRSDRNAKYNQLLRIEEELGDKAIYAGTSWRTPSWMAKSIMDLCS